MAISGTGVAVATAGAVLVYAGFTKQNPLSALRAIGSGHPAPVSDSSSYQNSADATNRVGNGAADVLATVTSSRLVAAAEQFQADQYSQARRWQNGYSDCSSFVGKAFKTIGITPPGASTTWDYLGWSALTKVDSGQVQAGDLICNATHIVIAVNATTAIGQENPRRNVQTGPINDLMYGTGSWVALRYTGGK